MKNYLIALVLLVAVSCTKEEEASLLNDLNATDSIATVNMSAALHHMSVALDSLLASHQPNHQLHWDALYHHHDSLFWHHHNNYHHEHYIHDDHHHAWTQYDPHVNHEHHYHHPYPGHHNDSLVTNPNSHHHNHNDHHFNGHHITHHHTLDSLHLVHQAHHP